MCRPTEMLCRKKHNNNNNKNKVGNKYNATMEVQLSISVHCIKDSNKQCNIDIGRKWSAKKKVVKFSDPTYKSKGYKVS